MQTCATGQGTENTMFFTPAVKATTLRDKPPRYTEEGGIRCVTSAQDVCPVKCRSGVHQFGNVGMYEERGTSPRATRRKTEHDPSFVC